MTEQLPQHEYALETFNEDKKIARIVFHFRFKYLFKDTINYNDPQSYGLLKEDNFIHVAIIELYGFRPNFNPETAKYSTVDLKIARRAMKQLLFSKKAKYTNEYVSIVKCPLYKNFDDNNKENYKSFLELEPKKANRLVKYNALRMRN